MATKVRALGQSRSNYYKSGCETLDSNKLSICLWSLFFDKSVFVLAYKNLQSTVQIDILEICINIINIILAKL